MQILLAIIIMLISKFKAVLIVIALITPVLTAVCPTGASVIPNCATCSITNGNTTCSTCINGYYLASSTCIQCSSPLPNCNQCSLSVASQPVCYICQSNYGLLNGICANCSAISGCATCQIWNYILQCAACNTGLVLYSAQMQCVPCQIPNCSNCSISNTGNFTCSSCAIGYYLAKNMCNLCSQSIAYCASCQNDQNGKLICSSCASTKLYLLNNTCSPNCAKGGYPYCSTCQLISLTATSMSCTSCIANYYLDTASENCRSCSEAYTGCKNCSQTTSGTGNATESVVTCTACASNYFLEAFSCVLCSSVKPNCQTCSFNFNSQSGVCTTCASGYYLNSADSLCYACPANSCSSCFMNGTALTCTACTSNYYLIKGACTTCGGYLAHCATCSFNNSFQCLSCDGGYLINAVGQCSLCSIAYPNCNFCNSVECTDCQAGFYTLNNKICLKNCLISNCNECVAKNNTKCSSCSTGYLMTSQFACTMIGCTAPLNFNGVACICPYGQYYVQAGNSCQPCSDPHCEQCPTNQCSQCLYGYFLQNNISCNKCMQNCEYCGNITNCFMCSEGFYFTGTSCNSYRQMVIGSFGVVFSNNYYQLCGLGCSSCTSTACVSCLPGYYLNGSACSFCPSNCKVCQLTFITISTTNTTTDATTNTTTNITTNSTVSSVVCVTCHSGMALINQTCSSCIDLNCVECEYNVFFCLLCSITYTADSSGNCKSCAANCNFCDIGGPGTCDDDSCFLGYAKFNLTKCIRCLDGCASCNGTYPYACIGCLMGSYTLQSTNTTSCVSCSKGCSACSAPNACTACAHNYNLVNGSCIFACVLPCVQCSFTNNSQVCQGCLFGYSLSNGTCIADFSCMSTSICEFCPLGFFAYQGSCHQCESNCISCTFSPIDPAFVISGNNYLSFLKSTQCNESFYLDTSMHCQTCPNNCSSCLSSNFCSRCKPSYFIEYKLLNGISSLNYTVGLCLPCSAECYQCLLQANRCISCKSGFSLSNFICNSLKNVSFTFTLISPGNSSQTGMYMSIAGDLAQLSSEIANCLGSLYTQNSYLLMLSSIVNGSVIVSGYANIDSSTSDPSTTYNSISSNVKQSTQISGYQIAAYSVSANGFTPTDPATTTTTSSSNYLLYIIIGSAILGVGIIALVVCLCLRYRRRKQKQEENQITNTEKVETEQNEPATSKNMLKSEDVYPKSSVRTNEPRKPKKPKQKIDEVSHISGNKTIEPVPDDHKRESISPGRVSKNEKSYKENQASRREIELSRADREPERDNASVSRQTKYRESRRDTSKAPQEHFVSRIDEQLQSEEITKREKSKSKSRSAKEIPESIVAQETANYKSSRNVPLPKDERSKAENSFREIEFLRNQTFYEQEKTEKMPASKKTLEKGKSNSISHKYVPNSNSHFI